MILDLDRFIREERGYWDELEGMLSELRRRAEYRLDYDRARRFYYLYRRAAADLERLRTFAAEPELQGYIEGLVARAYAEVHETREKPHRFRPVEWLLVTFPATFRRHSMAFLATLAITLTGCLFGAYAVKNYEEAKRILLPFGHGDMDPAKRVDEEEEEGGNDSMHAAHSHFAAMLMVNNTRVSITAMALGITWGFGTIIILFYNGVIMGGIVFDYVQAGEGEFLAGWLLPHGSVEIPAILIAGQAGLILGYAMIGWGNTKPLRVRLRTVSPDIMTLLFGVAILLVWAGIVESFFSQYHEPLIRYELKIGFGIVQLCALFAYLGLSGRWRNTSKAAAGERHD